ncbi:hypothetical protein MD484_g1556, partial [Candolleomyces efflorescens]
MPPRKPGPDAGDGDGKKGKAPATQKSRTVRSTASKVDGGEQVKEDDLADAPKTPVRTKRPRITGSPSSPVDPNDSNASPSKKLRGLSLGVSDSELSADEDTASVIASSLTILFLSCLQVSDSSNPRLDLEINPTGSKVSLPQVENQVDGSKSDTKPAGSIPRPSVVEPLLDDDDVDLKDDEPAVVRDNVFLEDFSNIHCRVLPAECGVPVYVRDQALYRHCPDMPQPNLQLGSIVTWKTRYSTTGDPVEEVALATVDWYKSFFRGNKTALRNILAGLASPLDGRFFNAACSDPRQFVAKPATKKINERRYELHGIGGSPVIGVLVGVCTRSDLRGTPPDGIHYRSIVVLPHRGHWERLSSFHCMNFGVEYLVGQVADGMVSIQTHAKEGSYPSRAGGSQYQTSYSPSKVGMKSYNSPTVNRGFTKTPVARTVPSVRAYGYDDKVPILDGTFTTIDYSSEGLSNHVKTLPNWQNGLLDVPVDSACMVGYLPFVYFWDNEWRIKLHVSFVIVLASPT